MREVPAYLHPMVQQNLALEGELLGRKMSWAVVLGLTPFRDGNQWCFLWGENLQEGVAGFGESVEDAMWAFDKSMREKTLSQEPPR